MCSVVSHNIFGRHNACLEAASHYSGTLMWNNNKCARWGLSTVLLRNTIWGTQRIIGSSSCSARWKACCCSTICNPVITYYT